VSYTSLKLDERHAEGKKLGKLRQDGYIPSVVYGGKSDSIMTQSKQIETTKVVRSVGRHTPVSLLIDGKKRLAIIKTIDIDPVKHSLRHVAFHLIKQNDVITTEVPLILTGLGESAAEKAGLVILQAIEHIEVKAKPADLPESIEVTVNGLSTIEDKISIEDLKLPEGVEFADNEQDLELVIANVYEPSALAAANEAAGGDAEAEVEPEEPTEGEEEDGEKVDSQEAEKSEDQDK
jgi:large subunit ribosomal protein L25